jgi:acetamidase/formamidase
LDDLPVPSTVTNQGVGDDLNRAFLTAYNESRNFLMDVFSLSEDEALSVMSTSVDYSVTQVVDSNW